MNNIESDKSKSFYILCIFVFLYPILPEFTKIHNLPIYDYLIIFLGLSFFTVSVKIRTKKLLGALIIYIPFLFLMLISYFYHHEYRTYFKEMIETVLVFALLYYQIDTHKKVEQLYDIILFAAFFLCLFGIIEYITNFDIFSIIQTIPKDTPMGAFVYNVRYGYRRIEASFGSPLPFAEYLTFINVISLYKILNYRKGMSKNRALYCFTWILSIVCVFMTAARMELFMLLLLQIVVFLQLRFDKKIIIAYSGSMLFLLLLITGKGMGAIFDSIYTVLSVFDSNFKAKSLDSETAYYRLQLYNYLSIYIKSNLLLGVGYNYSQSISFPQMGPYGVWLASSIDNNYLVWLLRYGIIGLLGNIYLNILPLLICINGLTKKIFSNLLEKKRLIGFACLFVAYIIDLISVYQMGERRIFIVCTALIFAEYKLKKREKLVI